MPLYLYQLSYTPESLAAQIKDPQDRLQTAAKPVLDAVGGKLVGGGFSFGEYDVAVVADFPDAVSAAAISIAVAAGGAFAHSKTTVLMSIEDGIEAVKKAGGTGYQPPSQ